MRVRYFCESCGKEVPRRSLRCPHCGKYFSSVQCPRCGHKGEGRDFDAGCPACGYLRLPHSDLRRVGPSARRGSGDSGLRTRGPAPSLYRILLLVLTLALLGILALLFFKVR
jgi:DNA-directed RNA polymerase subunit RPC12/RpoP